MFVTTRAVYDVDGNLLELEGYEYDGPVALCKGEGKKAEAEMKRANDREDKLVARQQAILDKIEGGVGKYLTGDVGFQPELLAMLKSQFLDQSAGKFNDAGSAVRTMLLRRGSGGGDNPVGGDYARDLSSLLGMQASSEAGGIRDIDMSNLQQMLNNKFNAASVMSGNAATLNSPIGTFGSQSANALGQMIESAKGGFWKSFSGALGSGLGGGIASVATGGLGGGLKKLGTPGF